MGLLSWVKNLFTKTGNAIEDTAIAKDEQKATSEITVCLADYEVLKKDREQAKLNATRFKNNLDKESTKISKEDVEKLKTDVETLKNITAEKIAIKRFERLITMQLKDLQRIIIDLNLLIKTEFHEALVDIKRPLDAFEILMQQFRETFEKDDVFIIPLEDSEKKRICDYFDVMSTHYTALVASMIELVRAEIVITPAVDRQTVANNMKIRSQQRQNMNRIIFAIKSKMKSIAIMFTRIKTESNAQTLDKLNIALADMEKQFDNLVMIYDDRRKIAKEMVNNSRAFRKTLFNDLKDLKTTMDYFYKEMQSSNVSPEQNKVVADLKSWEDQHLGDLRLEENLIIGETQEEKEESIHTLEAMQGVMTKFVTDVRAIVASVYNASAPTITNSVSQPIPQTIPNSLNPRHIPRSMMSLMLAGIIVIEAAAAPNERMVTIHQEQRVVSVQTADKELKETKENTATWGFTGVNNEKTYNLNVAKKIDSKIDSIPMTYAPNFVNSEFGTKSDSIITHGISSMNIGGLEIGTLVEKKLTQYLKDNNLDMDQREKDIMINESVTALANNPALIQQIITGSKMVVKPHSCIMGTSLAVKKNLLLSFSRGDSTLNLFNKHLQESTTDTIVTKLFAGVTSNAKIVPSIVIDNNQVQDVIAIMNKKAPNKFSSAEKKLFVEGQKQMEAFAKKLESLPDNNSIKSAIESINGLEDIFTADVIAVLKKFDANLIWLKKNDLTTWNAIKDKLDKCRTTNVDMAVGFELPVTFKSFVVIEKAPSNAILNASNPAKFIPQERNTYIERSIKPFRERSVATRRGGYTDVSPGAHFKTGRAGTRGR